MPMLTCQLARARLIPCSMVKSFFAQWGIPYFYDTVCRRRHHQAAATTQQQQYQFHFNSSVSPASQTDHWFHTVACHNVVPGLAGRQKIDCGGLWQLFPYLQQTCNIAVYPELSKCIQNGNASKQDTFTTWHYYYYYYYHHYYLCRKAAQCIYKIQ